MDTVAVLFLADHLLRDTALNYAEVVNLKKKKDEMMTLVRFQLQKHFLYLNAFVSTSLLGSLSLAS